MSTKLNVPAIPGGTMCETQENPDGSIQMVPYQRKGVIRLELPKDKGDLVTNFRAEVEADRVEVSRAMAPADCKMDIYVGKTIKIVGVVINMAEFERMDGSGEIDEKPYASIVLEDGTVIGTTGKALMGQLAYMVGAGQQGPFSPPLEFEVRRHKSTPPKQDYYSMRRVRDKQIAPKKGGA